MMRRLGLPLAISSAASARPLRDDPQVHRPMLYQSGSYPATKTRSAASDQDPLTRQQTVQKISRVVALIPRNSTSQD
jgi:hypothetical protein